MKNVRKTQRLWWQLALVACLGLLTIAGTPSSSAAQVRRGQVPAGAGTIFGHIVMNLDFHPTRTCGEAKFTISDSHDASKVTWGQGVSHIDVHTNTSECIFDAEYWPIVPGPVAVRAQIPCTSLDQTMTLELEPYGYGYASFAVGGPLLYDPNTCE
jgi:hypothetical protein